MPGLIAKAAPRPPPRPAPSVAPTTAGEYGFCTSVGTAAEGGARHGRDSRASLRQPEWTDAADRAAQGVLAAWLNQLSETQGVSLGPWDRVRIDQRLGRRRRPGRGATARCALDPRIVARRRVRLRAEHRPGRPLPEAEREDRPGPVAGAAAGAPRALSRRGVADHPADAG